MYAPSAGNEQPWHFVVIKDRAILDEIPKSHPYTQMVLEAPLAIVPCCDTSNLKYDGVFWIQDMSASIQNILLMAESLGLGTCWCGVYPRKEYMDKISELLGLPEHIIPVAVIAVVIRERKEKSEKDLNPRECITISGRLRRGNHENYFSPDSFKEPDIFTSMCCHRKGIEKWMEAYIVSIPMADGGEGTVDALINF